jgi:hypothetical protein
MKNLKLYLIILNLLISSIIIIPNVYAEVNKTNLLQNQPEQIIEEPEQQEEPVTLGGGRYRGFNCEIVGSVNAPFYCLRIPGLFYFIHSANGGEVTVYNLDEQYEVPLSGDEMLKMTFVLGVCAFVPPVHNFENLLPRSFGGKAFAIDVTLV